MEANRGELKTAVSVIQRKMKVGQDLSTTISAGEE
jgi:hypothetical protein